MALARLKTVEALRHCAPGEWGKLLGLDRAPEVNAVELRIFPFALSLSKGEWKNSSVWELNRSWFDKALLSVVEGLTTNGLTCPALSW